MGDNYRTTPRNILDAFRLLVQETSARTAFDALDLADPARVKAFARRYLGFDDAMAEVFAEGKGDTGTSTHAESLRDGLGVIDTYLSEAAAAVGTCRPPYPDKETSTRHHANPPLLAPATWNTATDEIGAALKLALESESQYAQALAVIHAAAATSGNTQDKEDLDWLAQTLVRSSRA